MTREKMLDLFERHMEAELAGDIDMTMATMSDNPHLTNIPVMTGGVGFEGVKDFYQNHLIGSKFFPPDKTATLISRTVDETQIVEELLLTFTHTTAIDWMLPGVLPTGKRVEIALVVIVHFEAGLIAHEHIYWDQASVLVQLGLLDPTGLPVSGVESARKVLDPSLPSRVIRAP